MTSEDPAAATKNMMVQAGPYTEYPDHQDSLEESFIHIQINASDFVKIACSKLSHTIVAGQKGNIEIFGKYRAT